MLLEKCGLKELRRKNSFRKSSEEPESDCITLYESIEKAKQAWMDAKNLYNEATEDDNIDALIRINACEEYIPSKACPP